MKNGKWVWAFFAALALVFVSCDSGGLSGGGKGNKNNGTTVEKTELTNLIAEATALKGSLTISIEDDGIDVPSNKEWVTTELFNQLSSAIAEAQIVLNNSNATDEDVSGAITALKDKIAEVNREKKHGTYTIDTSELDDLILDADRLHGSIWSSADGKDVPPEYEWATPEDLADLQTAIDTAKAVKNNPDLTEADLPDAIQDLQTAINTINDKKTQGTQSVDKSGLTTAINDATALKDQTEVSADGKDKAPTVQWVTQAVMDTFTAAIAAAQGVLGKDDATQEDMDAAKDALDEAVDAFKDERTAGTKVTADKAGLLELIETANTFMEGLTVSVDGSDILPTQLWVTQTEKDELEVAITTAQAVYSTTGATQTQIETAIYDLQTAITTAENARKPGIFAADKTQLAAKIAEAQELWDSTIQAASGADVYGYEYWATTNQKIALNAGITTAKGWLNNANATQAQVDSAVSALQTRITSFVRALGTKVLDTTDLQALIASATALRDATRTSTNGADVPKTEYWVPTSSSYISELTAAIDAAQALVGKASTSPTDVETATANLNAKKTALDNAKQPGTLALDKQPLIDKIAEAQALYNARGSIQDNAPVDAPEKKFNPATGKFDGEDAWWTPAAVATPLNNAITTQNNALAGITQQSQVTAGVAALQTAIDAFNNPTTGRRKGPGTLRFIKAGTGASHSSGNTVAFRQCPIATWQDNQYIVYYTYYNSTDGYVTFGTRKLWESTYTVTNTSITNPINDAHNSISIITDKWGYIHMALNNHNKALAYYRGSAPGVLPTTSSDKKSMVGSDETSVTYVEFYKMNGTGNLLFAYRQGGSGNGYMVLNRYTVPATSGVGTWARRQAKLLDGTVKTASGSTYSPYWQMYMDNADYIHLSWTFRESSDVKTNAHEYYIYSNDEGGTWHKKSAPSANVTLPVGPPDTTVVAQQAEKIWDIPQSRNLMNQTNMTGLDGNPYILTYFSTVNGSNLNPMQYRVIYHDGSAWKITQVSNRTNHSGGTTANPFLSGSGTITSPLSRPRMVVKNMDGKVAAFFICRYEDNVTTAATKPQRTIKMFSTADIANSDAVNGTAKWKETTLTGFTVNYWEPSFDTDLWKEQGKFHLYVQETNGSTNGGLADGGNINTTTYPATQVYNMIVDVSNPANPSVDLSTNP